MSTFGFITIGQSPRDDVLNSMIDLSHLCHVTQYGALDSLTKYQIRGLAAGSGEPPLVTRLRDGSEAVVTKQRLMPWLQQAVDRAVADGVDALVVLCTGEFPGLESPVPVIFPDRVLASTVESLLPSGTLGVVMPHEGQMGTMRAKWETGQRHFIGKSASPYTSSSTLSALGQQLRDERVDMIVLDCMGFSTDMKATVAESAGVPVILANRLVGQIIEEMLGGSAISATG